MGLDNVRNYVSIPGVPEQIGASSPAEAQGTKTVSGL